MNLVFVQKVILRRFFATSDEGLIVDQLRALLLIVAAVFLPRLQVLDRELLRPFFVLANSWRFKFRQVVQKQVRTSTSLDTHLTQVESKDLLAVPTGMLQQFLRKVLRDCVTRFH